MKKSNILITVLSTLLLIGTFTGCANKTISNSASAAETTKSKEGDAMQGDENPNLAKRVTSEEEYYIFNLSDNVTRTHVYYKNRFGIELAGDLYMAKNVDTTKKYPALVIGPPFGGVKEQGPGVYANQLAQRGFVVLTFDPSYHGYSGGEPRMVGSTDLYAEDFSAGVDYLGLQSYVDRDKIGAIGICGSGGFSLSAAAMDSRIKAVATSVMYDISGTASSMAGTGETRRKLTDELSQQRWTDAENGTPAFREAYPKEPVDQIPEGLDPVTQEFFSFYGMKRGWHPNALGNVNNTSMLALMNFPSLTYIKEISPRPILFIAGENAHSRGFSETAYNNAAEPKELYIVQNANHVDLYDQVDKIPFDKLESFFKEKM